MQPIRLCHHHTLVLVPLMKKGKEKTNCLNVEEDMQSTDVSIASLQVKCTKLSGQNNKDVFGTKDKHLPAGSLNNFIKE